MDTKLSVPDGYGIAAVHGIRIDEGRLTGGAILGMMVSHQV